MRLLLVSQELPPDTHWGGIGTYMGTIGPALVRAGAEVHVLSVVRHQPRRDFVDGDGVHVHRAPLQRLPAVGRLSRLPQAWERVSLAAGVAREVRRLGGGFDVVECPEWRAEGLLLALRRRFPLVVRLHSGAFHTLGPYSGDSLDARLSIRLEDAAVVRADAVTGTRPIVEEGVARLGLDPARVRPIIYPVVAAGPVRPVPGGPPRICFVGRFEARKSPDTLVRALPHVLAEVPDARLALVGRDSSDPQHPSWAAYLRRLAAERGVSGSVEFVDGADRAAVRAEVERASVCATPSTWESMGYVAAEALLAGRPVVASDHPGLAEVVDDGETGLLAPVGDERAWAAALTRLLLDAPKAAAMGAEGARRLRARCHPDEVARRTLAAYDVAIAHRARGARLPAAAGAGAP